MRTFPRCGLVSATTVALLLGLAMPTLASERLTDPVGDAPPDGPDIVAVTTTINADEALLLEIEFADELRLAETTINISLARWPSCDGYANDVHIVVTHWPGQADLSGRLGAFVSGARVGYVEPGVVGKALDYSLEGPNILTLTVPRVMSILNATSLYLGIRADRASADPADADTFPDDLTSCQAVSLPESLSASPSPAASPTAAPSAVPAPLDKDGDPAPWLIGGLAGLLVGAGVGAWVTGASRTESSGTDVGGAEDIAGEP